MLIIDGHEDIVYNALEWGPPALSLHSRCGRIEQYLRLLTLNMSLFLTAQRRNAHDGRTI